MVFQESPSTDHHFRREDRTRRWQRISEQIEAHPADLLIALDNIERWLTLGRVNPAPLLEWRMRILRDSILDTLPAGWRERLVPVPETLAAFALDPHDLAAVKLLVGRPKDLALVQHLHSAALLQPGTVRERIDLLKIPAERMPRLLASFQSILGP
ncbi:MAG: hypothetical protein NTV46_16035 [Verrucomicrobia bacterium]|nr:hypothetical protein [Verrucomicrobiota bacterium]